MAIPITPSPVPPVSGTQLMWVALLFALLQVPVPQPPSSDPRCSTMVLSTRVIARMSAHRVIASFSTLTSSSRMESVRANTVICIRSLSLLRMSQTGVVLVRMVTTLSRIASFVAGVSTKTTVQAQARHLSQPPRHQPEATQIIAGKTIIHGGLGAVMIHTVIHIREV